MRPNVLAAVAAALVALSAPIASAQQTAVDVRANLTAPAGGITFGQRYEGSFGTINIPPADDICTYAIFVDRVVVYGSEVGSEPPPVCGALQDQFRIPEIFVICPATAVPVTVTESVSTTSGLTGVQLLVQYAQPPFGAPLFNDAPVSISTDCEAGRTLIFGFPIAVRVSPAAQPAQNVVLGTMTVSVSL